MQVYNYIAWQLLKDRIVLMALYVESLFQASVSSLALVKVMWFEGLNIILVRTQIDPLMV